MHMSKKGVKVCSGAVYRKICNQPVHEETKDKVQAVQNEGLCSVLRPICIENIMR